MQQLPLSRLPHLRKAHNNDGRLQDLVGAALAANLSLTGCSRLTALLPNKCRRETVGAALAANLPLVGVGVQGSKTCLLSEHPQIGLDARELLG